MRHPRLPLIVAAALAALLLAALLPLAAAPATVAAHVDDPAGDSFGSAVPCLRAADRFAVTCFADTMFYAAPAGDPAVAEVGLSAKAALAAVGSNGGGGAGARVRGGLGSVYGLAYDDGAVSGRPRLFMAAFLKRLSGFGPGGPGGVYVYDLARRAGGDAPLFVVPDAGWDRAASAADPTDRGAVPHVGRSGLGDMEISPDGRELFVVNIAARRIERYDITAEIPVRRAPIVIDDGVRDHNDALDAAAVGPARADTVPFALEFSPLAVGADPRLILGLTDTGSRSVRGGGLAPPAGYPAVHLVSYSLASGTWAHVLTQSLDDPAIRERMRDSQIAGLWASTDTPGRDNPYGARGIRGWNPWHDDLARMPQTFVAGLNRAILYPQPLLADIEFSHDGRRMYLGLRDRSGDMVFAAEPPAGEFSAIAQGDTLVYDLRGPAWVLQTTARARDLVNAGGGTQFVRPAPSDFFDDSRHYFAADASPFHVENHGGALATALQGDGTRIAERVAATSLLGNRQSGITFYGEGGGPWSSAPNVLVTASRHAGGKSAALGDLEPLCTYAFVAGRVWHDVDGDGDQDAGEPGIAGVTLEAFRGSASAAPPLARATTDAAGRYRFALPPNQDIRIRIAAADRSAPGGVVGGFRFTLPNRAGGDDTRDSDASDVWGFVEFAGSRAAPTPGVTGAAIPAPVREQELASVDIGLTRAPAAGVVGDRVWVDENRNGLQDGAEPGLAPALLAAMSVELVPDPDTAIIAPAPVAVRLAGGRYELRGLPAGRYAVRFGGLPRDYAATAARVLGGLLDHADSDADPSTLTTHYVAIAAGQPANMNLDLGLVPDQADLAASIRATALVLPGAPIAYDVAVQNLPSSAKRVDGVTLAHRLPPGVALASAPAGGRVGGSPATGQTITWEIGGLAPGQSWAARVDAVAPQTLEPPAPGRALTSSVWAATVEQEVTLANNGAEASTVLVRPELSVEKHGPAEVGIGDEFVYTLRVANRGSAEALAALADPLPDGVTFVRWQDHTPAHCSYSAEARAVGCQGLALPPGDAVTVAFVVRAEPSAPPSVTNSVAVTSALPSDDPADNQASLSTVVLRPNPGVELAIVPDQPDPAVPGAFPVGTAGAIRVRYANGLVAPPAGVVRGPARPATLTLDVPAGGYTLGALPPRCTPAGDRITCALGKLAPGAEGTLAFPIALPADFAADRLAATATIATSSLEAAEDLGDNSASAGVDVVRPNAYVDAEGPAAIVGRGSVFPYTIDYGNLLRRAPALTRTAAGTALRVTLPDEVELVEADLPPTRVDGRALTWELGDLAPRAAGRILVVVRADVEAGTTLRLDAAIGTSSPGDDPVDNADSVVTKVVQPPATVPDAAGELRLAISSELDPLRHDGSPDNGVHLVEGLRFSWPAGETVELTPRLSRLLIPGEAELPYPYEYRARVVGWSLRAVTIDGRAYDPAGADGGGRAGCRLGAAPASAPQLLEGCAYGYVGGADLAAIRRAAPLREDQLRGQARLYWTRPPAPPLPGDIYLYAAGDHKKVRLSVQLEVEIQVVNAAPGAIGGVAVPEVPLPGPRRQLLAETFEVTLLVPRSVVGPGHQ